MPHHALVIATLPASQLGTLERSWGGAPFRPRAMKLYCVPPRGPSIAEVPQEAWVRILDSLEYRIAHLETDPLVAGAPRDG